MGIKAYNLEESKHLFKEKIIKIAQHPWINQAAYVAIELDLCDDIPIEHVLIPLFLDNKISIFYEYLDRAFTLQPPMIKYLDSLMEMQKYELENEQFKYNIKNTPLMNLKQIKNHIFKLCKRYRIDVKEVPIATRYQDGKHLRYIMHEYYGNEKLTKDIYEDKIKEIADKSKDLQIMLVELSCERGFVRDGANWNEHYKLSHDISKYGQSMTVEFTTRAETLNDDFYELPSSVIITYVDTEELFREMLQVLKDHNCAGIDCEQQSNSKLSTIQIAIQDRVFVIDVLALEDWMPKELWTALCANFFDNTKIAKLGIGISHDVNTISSALSIKLLKNTGYIDLNSIVKKCFLNAPGFKLPYQEERINERNDIGLSVMTKICLGKGLNKSFAISNWSIRPLRAQQINYAAIDAYCALAIYNVITEAAKAARFDLQCCIDNEMKKPIKK
jgi:hypothetical protein